jgi:formyltetrahydrofolate deformylase
MTLDPAFILTLSCDDRVGIVAAVTGVLATGEGFILDSQQFADLDSGRFFLRIAFASGQEETAWRTALAPIAARFAMDWQLVDARERPRVLIAVSRTSHCLNDLLHRWSIGALPIDPVGVVSNHEDMRALTEWHGLPFHHLPVDAAGRAAQESAFAALADTADLVVLARYMQILTPALTTQLAGRCINIHHSFLPSFKGAKPYHQAHQRGVKLIGATAHFVTTALDEGPIIEQAVERVDHRASVADLIATGRDIEAQVLARAVRWIAERRVFLNGQRTIIFR